jgi:hypothetical protein
MMCPAFFSLQTGRREKRKTSPLRTHGSTVVMSTFNYVHMLVNTRGTRRRESRGEKPPPLIFALSKILLRKVLVEKPLPLLSRLELV